jgi:hypothetical protein
MVAQPELFPPQISASDQERLRVLLYHRGWQTRRQLCDALGWTERQVRDVAESLGADIIRGQAGFKLTAQLHRDSPDIPLALQAADAAISQARKMCHYGISLRRELHRIIG